MIWFLPIMGTMEYTFYISTVVTQQHWVVASYWLAGTLRYEYIVKFLIIYIWIWFAGAPLTITMSLHMTYGYEKRNVLVRFFNAYKRSVYSHYTCNTWHLVHSRYIIDVAVCFVSFSVKCAVSYFHKGTTTHGTDQTRYESPILGETHLSHRFTTLSVLITTSQISSHTPG